MSKNNLDGWKKVKFGEVVKHIKDRFPDRSKWKFERYVSGDHIDNAEIRITKSAPIKGNELVIGSAFHMRFKPKQVLYVTRRGYLRKCGMINEDEETVADKKFGKLDLDVKDHIIAKYTNKTEGKIFKREF